MNEELQRWLDGEIPDDELAPELEGEARQWERLLDVRRQDVGPAPPWIEQGVMRGLPAQRIGLIGRIVGAITRPQTVRIRPVTAGALAMAALAVLFVWPRTPSAPGPAVSPPAGPVVRTANGTTASGQVYVQFVYVAPSASSVAVAGDFNDWSETRLTLTDPDGDGVWTGAAPLSPGLHKYMFVVDGTWVTDPLAERHVDDGFGNSNALISVMAPGSPI